ncbi:MAG: class IV adenylate cyclase [Ferruginibacter sp.]
MSHINIEFKARIMNIKAAEEKLQQLNPIFIGEDLQTDTYYNVPQGRLKLREGNIENALIYYERENLAGSKQSNVILYEHTPSSQLKSLIEKVHGIKTIVIKRRKIYFIDNVKFHFDHVENLGEFMEVEAIDKDGSIPVTMLQMQADKYSSFFEISPQDFIELSYSDMMINNKAK